MKLAIGSDHAGYPLKVQLLDVLRRKGHEIQDYGSYDEKPVDFPDIAKKVTAAILSGEAERGIMFCGTGVGAAIACRLCSDFSALKCWTVPRTAFMTSTARMTIVLSRLPVTKEMTAVIIKIMTIRSLNWLKNTAKTPCRFSSASPLGPCFCSRRAASSAESPSRPVASCSITSRACRRS